MPRRSIAQLEGRRRALTLHAPVGPSSPGDEDAVSHNGRIQRITMPSRSDLRRAEVSLRGPGSLPAAVVLQAAEQLRRVMAALDVSDFRITVAPDPAEPIES